MRPTEEDESHGSNIWIASFIPKDIANYTKAVPGGGGKTMIPGPTGLNDCYLTDQRSSHQADASRTRSTVEINTAKAHAYISRTITATTLSRSNVQPVQ